MSISRRKTLALLGGGVVLAAGSGAAAFVGTRTPTTALAPWTQAAGYADPRLNALSYAILAPNPHNLQPWMAELSGADEVVLHRDPERGLPETDPLDRQITIGFGCFIEQMAISASIEGFVTEVEPFPEGDAPGRPVARARFIPGAAPDPLAPWMLDRRSCKEPFDMSRPVSARQIETLRVSTAGTETRFGGSVAPAEVAVLRDLIWSGWEVESFTPRTLAESIDLLRVGRPEIEANPDGIDLQSPFLEALRRTGMLTRDSLLDTRSAGFEGTLSAYRDAFAATPAFVWLATAENGREDQIAAGRAWLRLNLAATGAGLALQPVSQVLQEYPEMAANRAEAHRLLGKAGETVQMLGRLGYGPDVPPAPRWPLEAKLVNAPNA